MDYWETGSYSTSYASEDTVYLNLVSSESRVGKTIPAGSTNISKARRLLDQIIERAKEDDEIQKSHAIKAGKGFDAIGEIWMVFHLKALKGLLET